MPEYQISTEIHEPLDQNLKRVLRFINEAEVTDDVIKHFVKKGGGYASYSLNASALIMTVSQISNPNFDEKTRKNITRSSLGYIAAHGMAIAYATRDEYKGGIDTPPFKGKYWDITEEDRKKIKDQLSLAQTNGSMENVQEKQLLPTISYLSREKVSGYLEKKAKK